MSNRDKSQEIEKTRIENDAGSEGSTFCNSYLQLFKFNLVEFYEMRVEGYQLVEFNEDNRTFNIIFSNCLNLNFDNMNEKD